jgi:mevalonate kinase
MTVVSVPGKVILMGEHAAVFGRPALVAALDRRLRVEIEPGDAGVRIELDDIGSRTSLSWQGVVRYTRRVRRRWQAFAADPQRVPWSEVRGRDRAHLPTVALGEVVEHLGVEGPPLLLRIRSDIPVGAGFGSSAALAVGVVVASLRFLGARARQAELDRLALDVERRQHGTPSGVDSATVLRGGVLWARRSGDRLLLERIASRSPFLERLHLYSTGAPQESTGEVVAEVGRRVRERGLEPLLERMERCCRELRRVLEGEEGEEVAAQAMRECEACLEELGVVPPPVREVVRQVEAAGGVAKISGAGALSGSGAGSLLVYHPDPARLARCSTLARMTRVVAPLGAGGAREEHDDPRRRQGH